MSDNSAQSDVPSSSAWVRVVLQQVEQATLLIDNVSETTSIGNGLIVFVAFLKRDNVSDAEVRSAVSRILGAKIHTVPGGPLKGTFRDEDNLVQRDVLVVPQATLCGKLKGKQPQPQYYGQIAKELGAALYARFWAEFETQLAEINAKRAPELAGKVRHGTYGNRQALSMNSSGPNSHLFEF